MGEKSIFDWQTFKKGFILFYFLFYEKMKKFSFLLLGVFLLWTITFVLAEDSREVETATWTAVEAKAEESVTTTEEATATEATTWDTVEVTEEATATEVATWDTAEATTWATAEFTPDYDTAEYDSLTWTKSTDLATPTISDSAKEKYGEEQIAAYERALEKGITTINDVEKAKLSDWLTRAQLAKMMSQYMTNVLWKTPAVTEEKANYADVNESLGDLADYIQTAYAYKIMWINADGTPLKNFNPNGKVTRAEYATVFSRVLFGDKYNKSEWNYYENHLKALKDAEILTNTTPSIQEVRGWVMLMMYRSSQNGEAIEKVANATVTEETPTTVEEVATEEVAAVEESTGATIWPNPAAVYCEEQWGTVSIVKDAEWNEAGMCKLADGTEVDEREYYRANHPEETTTSTEDVTSVTETATWDTAEITAETATTEVTTWDTAEAPVAEPALTESN